MKRILLFVGIIIFHFFLCASASAQTNQTVTNGSPTTTITFPGPGCVYNWVNDTPGIGLPATGSGNIASFTAVNSGSSPVTATIKASPVSEGFAYIANAGDGTISVINTATNTATATITPPHDPFCVSISPDGSKAYVGCGGGSSTVTVINTLTNAIINTIPVSSSGESTGIVVSPDGSTLYVANDINNTVSVVNALTGTVLTVVPVGPNPYGIAISPDGSKVYIAFTYSNYISVISTATNTVIANITVGQAPTDIVVSPDGSKVYVPVSNSNHVAVIDAVTNSITAVIPITAGTSVITLSPDGTRAYVITGVNNVSVINTSTNTILATVAVGLTPEGISISPDGHFVYVANTGSKTVSVINTSTNAVVATVGVGITPVSLGNFVTGGTACTGVPVTFTITVNPAIAPTITASLASGIISACTGSASTGTNIQQFTVSGSNLTGNIIASAPAGFEVSLVPGSGYSSSVTLIQTSGTVNNTVIYARAAATALTGNISGNVTLSSAGATNQNVAVMGIINALPIIDSVPSQTLNNGDIAAASIFTGLGPSVVKGLVNTITWINDTPSIGLPASGVGDIAPFTVVNTGSSPVTATITATPTDASAAYIVNSGIGPSMSVIPTASNKVVLNLSAFWQPFGVSASKDGSTVYISNEGITPDGTFLIQVMSTTTSFSKGVIVVGTDPKGLVVSQDGSRLYVANYLDGTISVANTATLSVISTISVGPNPFGVAVSPDGSRLYVTQNSTGKVTVLNTLTGSIITTIPVGAGPSGIAVSPDGSRVYVANQNSNTVSVINTATNQVIVSVVVGSAPFGVTVSPDGSKVYVSNKNSNNVSVITAATNTVTATIATGLSPEGVSLTPDGASLYVSNFFSNSVTVINTATNTVTTNIQVQSNPVCLGNFISAGTGCTGVPDKFTITVKPASGLTSTLNPGVAFGRISACAGTASVTPQVQQIPISGNSLKGNVTVTAPLGFEVSLAAGSGYSGSTTITVPPSGGNLSNIIVYVRSAASASPGSISGNVVVTSTGATSQNVAVSGIVYPVPAVNPVPDQVVTGGKAPGVNFSGTANTYSWTNDVPGIDLAASGTGNITAFTAENAGATPVVAHISVTPSISGYAYVPNYNSNNVSVVSTLTNNVVATIPVGQNPSGAAISADGSKVYISNFGSNTVSVISTATNTVTATIPTGVNPYGMCLSPDGTKLYVTDFGLNFTSQYAGGALTTINTLTNASVTIGLVVVGGPAGIAISPDGSSLYIANASQNAGITVINTATMSRSLFLGLWNSPTALVLSPDGSKVYVTVPSNNSLLVIDASRNDHNANAQVIATVYVGSNPGGVALSPDGNTAYVTNRGSNSVTVIDTKTFAVKNTISVGAGPVGVSVSPDGTRVYVTNSASNSVSVINAATNAILTTVPVGTGPAPLGNFVSGGATCSGTPINFSITVNPTPTTAVITPGLVTGNISACAGTASANPNIQQFTVSGSFLSAGITAGAPTGFEVSLSPVSGFGTNLTIPQSGANVNAVPVYIRSAASAPPGNISGNILLSSGATNLNVAVSGTIIPLPVVNAVPNQVVTNGTPTAAINYNGTGSAYSWTNDNPAIGLPASGTGDIASFTGTNNTNTPIVAHIQVTPVPATYAYVPYTYNDTGSVTLDNLAVINTSTNKLKTTIITDYGPLGVAVSPDGTRVYITNTDSFSINVISTITNTIIATIPISNWYPSGIAISPDGSTLYVGVGGNILVINTTTFQATATIGGELGGENIIVSADGNKVYVSNGLAVSVIDANSKTVIATINGFSNAGGLVLSPDGSKLYVTNIGSIYPIYNTIANTVSVVDLATNTIVANIPVGSSPYNIALSPDGTTLYVPNFDDKTVSVISTTTNAVTDIIPVGKDPYNVSITPDGKYVYVLNIRSKNISVISTATKTVTVTIPLTSNPYALGNFIAPPIGCSGIPTSFTITVNPSATITATAPTGSITACAGTPSVSPNIQQFSVSGFYLTDNITITAPAGFEISLDAASGYGNSLIITPTSGTVNSTVIYVRSAVSLPAGVASASIKLSSAGIADQNVTVNGIITTSETPVISISSSANSICSGTLVTFTAVAANGGSAPTYQWMVNGTNAGTNSATFTDAALVNNDIVSCTLTSNAACTVPAASNNITMVVTTPAAPSISIEASENSICAGTPVTFTATPTNGGNSPKYQWLLNGANAGTNNVSFTSSTFANGDIITCMLTSDAMCALPSNATSNAVTLTVNPLPVANAGGNKTIDKGASVVLNASATGDIADISWSPTTGLSNYKILNPLASPTSTTIYTLTVQTTSGCTATDAATVTVLTDVIIPNTFTPNGDGINDTWNIKYLIDYPNCTVNIFDRYGGRVFSSVGYGIPWDGRIGGANAPQGTYYYIINLQNGSKILSGNVTLIR